MKCMWRLDGGASIIYDGMDRKERLRHRREMYRIEKHREERLRRNREYTRHQKVAIDAYYF